MSLKKKGVPKDFEINKAFRHKRKVYIPLNEIVAMLKFHRGLKGDAIAKLLLTSKVNNPKTKKKSLFSRLFK